MFFQHIDYLERLLLEARPRVHSEQNFNWLNSVCFSLKKNQSWPGQNNLEQRHVSTSHWGLELQDCGKLHNNVTKHLPFPHADAIRTHRLLLQDKGLGPVLMVHSFNPGSSKQFSDNTLTRLLPHFKLLKWIYILVTPGQLSDMQEKYNMSL